MKEIYDRLHLQRLSLGADMSSWHKKRASVSLCNVYYFRIMTFLNLTLIIIMVSFYIRNNGHEYLVYLYYYYYNWTTKQDLITSTYIYKTRQHHIKILIIQFESALICFVMHNLCQQQRRYRNRIYNVRKARCSNN